MGLQEQKLAARTKPSTLQVNNVIKNADYKPTKDPLFQKNPDFTTDTMYSSERKIKTMRTTGASEREVEQFCKEENERYDAIAEMEHRQKESQKKTETLPLKEGSKVEKNEEKKKLNLPDNPHNPSTTPTPDDPTQKPPDKPKVDPPPPKTEKEKQREKEIEESNRIYEEEIKRKKAMEDKRLADKDPEYYDDNNREKWREEQRQKDEERKKRVAEQEGAYLKRFNEMYNRNAISPQFDRAVKHEYVRYQRERGPLNQVTGKAVAFSSPISNDIIQEHRGDRNPNPHDYEEEMLRGEWEEGVKTHPDWQFLNLIKTHYSRILDNIGLNAADPIAANIGHFNITGKVFADPVKVGRTVIFITRPNLNFRILQNIERSPIFLNFYGNKMGRTLMRYLQHGRAANEMFYMWTPDKKWRVPRVGRCDDYVIGGRKLNPMWLNHASATPDPLSVQYNDHFLNDAYFDTNFIPLLSNTCTETSNAKDIILDVWETEGDYSGNKLQYASGVDETMSIGEITLTFDDLYFSPVMNLMYMWIMYMHNVRKNIMKPDGRYIFHRIIDYTCSIYIFMLDTDGKTIVRWIKYGGAFPRTIPFGQILHSQEPNQQQLKQIQVPFAYNFADPMNPLTLTEFNMLAGASLHLRFDDMERNNLPFTFINAKDGALETAYRCHNYIANNTCTLGNAYQIRRTTDAGITKPKRMLKNPVGTDYIESPYDRASYFMGMRENVIGWLGVLRNYSADTLYNPYKGVPYISGGNVLMYI